MGLSIARWLAGLLLVVGCAAAPGYSVQTHEQMIDLVWLESIEPLLTARYPGITAAQLEEAHAYAYGGSAIQDLGYYPFGNQFFSNLTHYVRSGDFVLALLHGARNADELAFAVGALSHYWGDTYGHSVAVNPSVAVEFPKLGRRYGQRVSYEDDKHAHVRTEFAFDINEIAKRRFAPLSYLRHVGLGVPTPLLARAFFEVYGLNAEQILGRGRPVVRGYAFGVRRFLPRIAYAETVLHRKGLPADTPGPELDELTGDLRRVAQANHWEDYRKGPGIGTYSLAALILILPKVGVLSELSIRGPEVATEELYVRSVNGAAARLRASLKDLARADRELPNRDLDTGQAVRPGAYRLTDETYAELLGKIAAKPGQAIPPTLKHDLQAYYADPQAAISTQKNAKKWGRVQADLRVLAGMATTTVVPVTSVGDGQDMALEGR